MCALFDKTKEQEIVNSYMNEGKSMNWLSRYYHCRSSKIKNETKISYKKSKSSIAYCSQFHAQRLIKRLLEELYLNCSIYLTRKYNVAKTALAHF